MSEVEPNGVLLDTCAVIWLAVGAPLSDESLHAIMRAGQGPGIHVSPISAWEIGLLARGRRSQPPALMFQPDVKTWFGRFMSGPGIREAALTPAMAIDASSLPGNLPADPADRLLIAAARHMGMPIVTRDRRILDYASAGFVETIPC